MRWYQKNGSRVKEFVINSVEGEWTDISKDGMIQFLVTDGELKGKVKIEKNDRGINLSLDFTEASENGIHQRFFISQVQRENP
jgi:hypothetical protein